MRKLFAVTLFALLLGVGVIALIETDPGYVLVSYGSYTLETSLWVGLLLLFGGQRSLSSWFGTRKLRHASRLSTRGLINFIEGDWARSRRQLLRGARNNDAPLLNYLLAARASHHLGETGKVIEFLGAATDGEPSAADAVQLVEAEILVHEGQYDQALEVLGEIGNATHYPRYLELKRTIFANQRDWASLAGLLPDLRKRKILPAGALLDLERETYKSWLLDVASDEALPDSDDVRRLWEKLPGDLKKDVELECAYVQSLRRSGDVRSAEKVLLKALKQHWDARLVRQYGLLAGEDAAAQLAQAETWLQDHPDDPELLLCLGRLAARDKLWGKARDYFENSYRLQHDPEVCAELGRLLTGLGEPKVAAAYFREGLLLSEAELPDLPEPAKLLPLSQRLARS